ncbi:hypothetical protein PCASD_07859 [Puccinia coronata f. sp. avenae]|uniref:SSD domain-containing protein n=1 Tax=Puccinia coronata f. sp. avenae TaxID=200324 RepID=A0A2N5UQT5_9BASI|nr:hypothetical protein PCASD_07859 [Puccinia coronata f. sp. avenae]
MATTFKRYFPFPTSNVVETMKNANPTNSFIGRCAMYDRCGKKGTFGQELPCPDNSPARKTTSDLQSALSRICGSRFESLETACCTQDQIEDLSQSLSQAEPLISSCPACRNNFREFYCHFTCSPDQASFLNVTSTQQVTNSKTGKLNLAVKTVDFWVDPRFGNAFFDSCKEVKFGATNGYVMDLIGGGAKSWNKFLQYMGDEKPGLGSPFQINFPTRSPITSDKQQDLKHFFQFETTSTIIPTNSSLTPLNPDQAFRCDSVALDARCACSDCPAVCASLPPPPPLFIPSTPANNCHVGQLKCADFFWILLYSLALSGTLIYITWKEVMRRRKIHLATSRNGDNYSGYETPSGYERVSMHDPLAPTGSELSDSPEMDDEGLARSDQPGNPLIGASSMADAEGAIASRSVTSLSPTSHSFFTHHHRFARGSSSMTDADIRLLGIQNQPRSYPLNVFLSRVFYRIGYACSSKPYLTITLAFLLCGFLNLGWSMFEVEKDPVKLWAASGSKSAADKADFENRFGPFYRTEQIFLSSTIPDQPVLNYERLRWIADLEQGIRNLHSNSGHNLTSVCLAPTATSSPPKSTSDCVVESIMGYFGNSLKGVNEHNWSDKLNECASAPASCLPPFGSPLKPTMVLGGLKDSNDTTSTEVEASEAKAVIITFVVNNHLELEQLDQVKEWETTLKVYLEQVTAGKSYEIKDPRSLGMNMAWSTEISLESEINKSTNTDFPIVVLSYLAMFLYVAINLGGSGIVMLSAICRGFLALAKVLIRQVYRLPGNDPNSVFPAAHTRSTSLTRQLLVESKFSLALWSILIVLLSVSTSVGLFSLLGIKITLIIAEVIPFLVLAIGVDNVFILANEVSRQNSKAYTTLARGGLGFNGMEGLLVNEDEDDVEGLPSVETRIAMAVSRMGPSVLLSASCEALAFALGAIVGMPAVRNFAIYAAGAVIINTLLQMTVFVSAMSIDLHRMELNKMDCLPCIHVSTSTSLSDLATASGEGDLARFFRAIYMPFLMKRKIKILVLCIFSGLFVFSALCSQRIVLGLDQRLALPRDSHLVDYFNALDNFFEIGPPVYFVTRDVDPTSRDGQQKLCGRFSTCQPLSLANVLEGERKRPESSFIAQPSAVWIDDFLHWLNPTLETCCRVRKHDPEVFCTDRDRERDCQPCFQGKQPPWNITMSGLPRGPDFMKYLGHWLDSPTTDACPLGGKASYYNAIDLSEEKDSVLASHFRTYHTPLKQQSDYINAMTSAMRISEDLSKRTGGKVYPYSIFYVFFEQYGRIVRTSKEVIILALAAVFVVSSILLGSWQTGGIMCMTVLMIIGNMTGGMAVWKVDLNAISLVNLVIGVGIGIEFCSHIVRAFTGANGGGLPKRHHLAQRDRDERITIAMSEVGSSVFAGIFSTKFIGIAVLGLTKSKLLETYFFKMWLILIISGGLHGLVFLPVMLSYFGDQGYELDDDQELGNLVQARYEAEQHQRNQFSNGNHNGDDDDDDDDDDD